LGSRVKVQKRSRALAFVIRLRGIRWNWSMSWSAQYRSEAAECLATARAAERNNSKALFRMMADAWLGLADQVEAKAQPSATTLALLKQSCGFRNSTETTG
jgi:hypothetical protein